MKFECHICLKECKARLDKDLDVWRLPWHKKDAYRCSGSGEIVEYSW